MQSKTPLIHYLRINQGSTTGSTIMKPINMIRDSYPHRNITQHHIQQTQPQTTNLSITKKFTHCLIAPHLT